MPPTLPSWSEQHKNLPIIPTPADCKGKTYIVTGANSGLGYECAKHLVRLGAATVILAVRSITRGEAAKTKIEAETGIKNVAVVWQLDLASYESVKAFVKKVEGLERVDAIIENAGIAMVSRVVAEGLESSLVVNVVSTILLAILVLPKLQGVARRFGIVPQIVVVGSEVAFSVEGELEKVDGDILEGLNKYDELDKRYPTSKLLSFYATRQLASLRPVSETGVSINYLNPGFCKTDLSQHAPFIFKMILRSMLLVLGRTAEMGSRTLLHAAFAGVDSHGKFLSSCEIKEQVVPTWATSDAGKKMQARVWDSLSKKLNTIQPGII